MPVIFLILILLLYSHTGFLKTKQNETTYKHFYIRIFVPFSGIHKCIFYMVVFLNPTVLTPPHAPQLAIWKYLHIL